MNTDDRMIKLIETQNKILDRLATATVRVADALEHQNSVDPLQAIERALMAGVSGDQTAAPMTAPGTPTAPGTAAPSPEIGADEAYRFQKKIRP